MPLAAVRSRTGLCLGLEARPPAVQVLGFRGYFFLGLTRVKLKVFENPPTQDDSGQLTD